jgi:hypothetical protein
MADRRKKRSVAGDSRFSFAMSKRSTLMIVPTQKNNATAYHFDQLADRALDRVGRRDAVDGVALEGEDFADLHEGLPFSLVCVES